MRQTTNPLKVGVKISPIDCRLRNRKFFNLTDDQFINFFEWPPVIVIIEFRSPL